MKKLHALLAVTILLSFSIENVYSQGDNPLPSISSIGQSATINCTSAPETIGVDINGWVPGFIYQWNTGETDSVITVQPSVTTTYILQISNPDLGINALKGFEIKVKNDPIITQEAHYTVDKFTCAGSELKIEPIVYGGHQPFMYRWEDASTHRSNRVYPAQDNNFNVTITDVCGTEAVASVGVHLEAHDPIIPPAEAAIEFDCDGDEVTLAPKMKHVSGGVGQGYIYSSIGGLSGQPLTKEAHNGDIFTFEITDACGVQIVQTQIHLIEKEREIPTPTALTVCNGQTVDVAQSDDNRFYFWNGQSMNLEHEVQVTETMRVPLSYIDECGNDHLIERVIEVDDAHAAFDYDVHAYSDNVDLFAEIDDDVTTYTWFLDGNEIESGISVNVPMTAGTSNTVELEVQNKNGCIARTSKVVTMRDNFSTASAFSPNSDGHNDFFQITFDEAFESFSMQIFDRWGQLIFESSDQYFTWDGGTQTSRELNTYVYRIKGTTVSGQKIDRSNTLTVVN